MIARLLPDFCYSSRELEANSAIVHYISAIYVAPDLWDNVDTVWNMLVELNRPGKERGPLIEKDEAPRAYASYHILIDRDGNDYRLTPPNRQAYHAGKSEWHGKSNCNAWTYGIALIATHDSGYTPPQYERLIEVTKGMDALSGHEDVATPKGRKHDPGPCFDWDRVAHDFSGRVIR